MQAILSPWRFSMVSIKLTLLKGIRAFPYPARRSLSPEFPPVIRQSQDKQVDIGDLQLPSRRWFKAGSNLHHSIIVEV